MRLDMDFPFFCRRSMILGWMVFGSMAFFYGGGTAWLKGIQAKRVRRANAAAVSMGGPGTPGVAPTVPPVDAVFQKVERKMS